MPGEFDATTQHYGQPLWASQWRKRNLEGVNEVFRRPVREKNKRYKFKRNEQGNYINNEGNLVFSPDEFSHQYHIAHPTTRPLSDADLLKANGYVLDPNKPLLASSREKRRTELTSSLLERLRKEEQELNDQNSADLFNKEMIGKGLVPLEEYRPYQRYEGERIEEFSPEQEKLFRETARLSDLADPKKSAAHLEASQGLQPGMQTQQILDSSRQFLTPYQDLFKAWKEQASDEFKDRLQNEINPKFLTSGTWGSGAHRSFQQKALEQNEKNLRHRQAEYLAKAQREAHDQGSNAYQLRQHDLNTLLNEDQNTFKKTIGALGVRQGIQKERQDLAIRVGQCRRS
jgi:hypothetical protein